MYEIHDKIIFAMSIFKFDMLTVLVISLLGYAVAAAMVAPPE